MSFAGYMKFMAAERTAAQKRIKARTLKLVKVMVELSVIDSPSYTVSMDLQSGRYPQLRIYNRKDFSELVKGDFVIPYHVIRGYELEDIQKEEKETMEYLEKLERDLRKYVKLMKDGN